MKSEVFRRARFLEMNNYPMSPRECIVQAVRELVPENELIDMYALYGITYDEYIEDMVSCYMRYKTEEVTKLWRRASSIVQ